MSRLQRQTSGMKTRRQSDPVWDDLRNEIMAAYDKWMKNPENHKRLSRMLRKAKK